MKISDLINEKYEYRWDVIQSIPEFAVLETCEQNPRWHSEGNAWIHTKMVCTEARNLVVSGKIFESPIWKVWNMVFLAAALFHDIGKGVTTKLGRDGNWHSYGHDVEGEKITRYLLWDENPLIREDVCALVRWHMEPLHIFEHKDWLSDIINISHECMWKMLLALEECDVWGSIKSEEEEKRSLDTEILASLTKLTISNLHCYETPYGIPLKRNIKCEVMKRERDLGAPVRVTVLIGIAGAGKSTFAESLKKDNSVILSRDTIREELGYCGKGEKVILSPDKENVVTAEFEKQMIDAAKEGKHIILDNLNTKKKYRERYKQVLKNFNIIWEYIYIQAPSFNDNVKRRRGMIDEKTLKDMIFRIEWPRYDEYDEIKVYISNR